MNQLKNRVKYNDLLDYTVKVLDQAREIEPNAFVSLSAFFNLIEYKHSFADVVEIGKYMEAMGWAKASYPIGDVRLQITTTGRLYIENKGEEFNASYHQFLGDIFQDKPKDDDIYIKLLDEQTKYDPKSTIYKLIEVIKSKIKDANVGGGDLDSDIEIVRLEISKQNPDLRVIETKLNGLENFTQILDEVSQLKDYIQSRQIMR